MGVQSKLTEIVLTHIVGLKDTSSGWKKANCPMCVHYGHRPDTKSRLGVKVTEDGIGMNCFNCGFKTRWSKGYQISQDLRQFLSVVGLSQTDIDALTFEAFFNRKSQNPEFSLTSQISAARYKWEEKSLPEGTKTIVECANEGITDPDFLSVVNYAISRGIDDFERVAWCPEKNNMMSRRLIVPFTWNEKTVGFSARSTGSTNKQNRYYHEIPNHFVYNLDRQKQSQKYVIVMEGVFDALLTGGVALLHNTCSDEQAQEINMLRMHPIVCPDRDSSGTDLVNIAIKNKWSVSFPPWEYGIKDAGDAVVKYGKLFTVYSILKYATNDPDKIRLWRKMDLEKNAN
jgi:hypothetical protein